MVSNLLVNLRKLIFPFSPSRAQLSFPELKFVQPLKCSSIWQVRLQLELKLLRKLKWMKFAQSWGMESKSFKTIESLLLCLLDGITLHIKRIIKTTYNVLFVVCLMVLIQLQTISGLEKESVQSFISFPNVKQKFNLVCSFTFNCPYKTTKLIQVTIQLNWHKKETVFSGGGSTIPRWPI